MLRRAKSFMVKNQQQQPIENDELSETAHLRRKFIPTATTTTTTQPIFECIPQQQHRNKPPPPPQNIETRRSFRGLRRQISISVDNVMKSGLFNNLRKRQETECVVKKDGVCVKNSIRKEGEKPSFEVQHNNASRLRMNQFKKTTN